VKRTILWLLAGALALTGAILMVVSLAQSPPYHGTLLEPAGAPADFTLHSRDGPVGLADVRGNVVAMYFGYTFCPDHCPLTMSHLARAVARLGESAARVRVVMVSVDPERDTPEIISEYARGFDPRFIGLSGTPDEIAAVAKRYGIFYAKRQVESGAQYLVDHTVSILVLDKEGRLRLIWPSDIQPDAMAADLERLVGSR
jgi:protein SCO1